MPSHHVPVLSNEVLHWLDPQAGQVVVDGTLGGGGHTRLLAERIGGQGTIIAMDRDPASIEAAERELAGLPIVLAQANYCDLQEVFEEVEIAAVDAILLDLGISSDQLDSAGRGFGFSESGPLDMRMDPEQGESAADLVNRLDEKVLADLIFRYGEERYSRRIARAIVEQRKQSPLATTDDLAALVRRCVPRSQSGRIDPATRTFQALRIAVNDELASLDRGLKTLPDCLKPGGCLAIISFHSLEDRPVKQAFRDDERLEMLTRRPIRPTEAEVQANPRSRSAKMRVARRREF